MYDRTEEAQEDLESSLNGLTNKRLVHLYDILTDNRRQLGHYYGENAGPFNNTEAHANHLARDFKESVSEFLHRDSNDFTRAQRNRRVLDTILMEQGLSFDEIEEYDPKYTEYLLILYHLFYDADRQELKEYQYLAAALSSLAPPRLAFFRRAIDAASGGCSSVRTVQAIRVRSTDCPPTNYGSGRPAS